MRPAEDIHAYFEDFGTTRWDVKASDVQGFEKVLEHAKDEHEPQQYLQAHPQLLCAYLRSGHGEWVIPQKRLGAEYVPDFAIGCGNSGGMFWEFIELESPCAPFVLQNGQATKELRTAIHQVESWRAWLEDNLDYARKPPASHGLGLEGVSPRSPALVVIGRRANVSSMFNQLRKIYRETSDIDVVTYDRLLDAFRGINGIIEGCRGQLISK